ncbi:DUF3888 domain-containing protein [Neobacillus sp. PS3-40]|uniref:DUF3888 domain-containing protein n=1 Tax=Neobacillus sp. PS3-40 TaxID=3070679 RepID=UPI0027E16579|nr:DUF3888 domain-containing protein [Neobacillus sp. PS3-40]WML43853.1 DUF3888 domain-containing protein [Neobacillus sp. PS3-40]
MKKLLSVLLFLCFMAVLSPNSSKATELPQDVLEEVLIKQLQEPILFIVGRDWFRGKEKILEIKQDKQNIDLINVTVQVVCFYGPHNPPYTEEIITFSIAGNKVRPIDYFNRVIPENDWHKFQLE